MFMKGSRYILGWTRGSGSQECGSERELQERGFADNEKLKPLPVPCNSPNKPRQSHF